jgi:hypothetical protein
MRKKNSLRGLLMGDDHGLGVTCDGPVTDLWLDWLAVGARLLQKCEDFSHLFV